jgi:CO dehydrogenase/acetyl-CoA synthase delta subunit
MKKFDVTSGKFHKHLFNSIIDFAISNPDKDIDASVLIDIWHDKDWSHWTHKDWNIQKELNHWLKQRKMPEDSIVFTLLNRRVAILRYNLA